MPAILIPALDPEPGLISYVETLLAYGVPAVIVVDDGSSSACAPVFAALEGLPRCTVLRHPVNRGKGAALKTAIRRYLAQGGGNGLVTADCDGQHAPEDVLAVSRALETHPDRLILGCRDFGGNTPPRSAVGNAVTSAVMSAFYGVKLKDTQTGLRGLPAGLLPRLAELEGDRYEYELNMLILARRSNVELEVVPIRTLYFDRNSGSRFRPLADSLRIAALLGRDLAQHIGTSVRRLTPAAALRRETP